MQSLSFLLLLVGFVIYAAYTKQNKQGERKESREDTMVVMVSMVMVMAMVMAMATTTAAAVMLSTSTSPSSSSAAISSVANAMAQGKMVWGGAAWALGTTGSRKQSSSSTSTSSRAGRHAYATMLYMGTPRDHEFYIAARVMMQSLLRLRVDADLVVIASKNLPSLWVQTLERENVKVVSVDDIPNPYSTQDNFNSRFRLTLNKLYAWSLVDYERVVMLDADNIFLRKSDELFQCGQFCAVFINPCIFHTGLFVLEPSKEMFQNMCDGLKTKENRDGADQGYLMAWFDDLLERPLFVPPANGSKVDGYYRLPLGYQMDASYFYLKLRWNVPCGPNSVITFPSMPWLKPWYWWSWPVLPLGLQWHEQRRATIGYAAEVPVLVSEALFYVGTLLTALVIRRRALQEKVQPGRGNCSEGSLLFLFVVRIAAILGSFILPAVLIPRTVHPLMGWFVELLGAISLLFVIMAIGKLPVLVILTPWFGVVGALLTLAAPIYSSGIVRALGIGFYAFVASPFLWWVCKEIFGITMGPREAQQSKGAWNSLRSEPPSSQLTKIC